MSPVEWVEAERTTIDAHYTDPALGFANGSVLEPGSDAGTSIGLAPDGAAMTGVELDSSTSSISAAVCPEATIRAESFADTRLPSGHFDAAVEKVPFANIALQDPVHNAGRHEMHSDFILKSLTLTRPGGMVAVLTATTRWTARIPVPAGDEPVSRPDRRDPAPNRRAPPRRAHRVRESRYPGTRRVEMCSARSSGPHGVAVS